jgi:CTP:molybdopterin cytidylyltransferase MocA
MEHRLIVLAAGEGLQLDGFNKALIRHPRTRERVLDQYLRLFGASKVTVVVGYRAIEIMHRYPQLHYVYNSSWRLTGNAYSLGLALDASPCFVLSADFFLDEAVIDRMRSATPNAVIAASDPEAPGIFKIESPALLREWKARCIEHSNLFALQNLPLDHGGADQVFAAPLGDARLFEVNTPLDYLNLIESETVTR